ncbi:2-dehydro-3-deoxyphosphogluconate aldolase [Pseudoclavibacter sp. RFBJ3]|uniref:bifunctional 4-hydroxy-2-oxoglutarate aldolase/2-dehydro-3-deoxy-phosphogluconate aldolase n=1 Tax=unclassified Pseudoclavibacter TaxID=2615177 RepID=UPI000CE75D2B|nr:MULTISPECIES: bifunctional 4-hydroxy-2-oxoglutarate aldolase/2-dehydro-3-deoxy-phosphogluconate aldolase [unclassified Pseudoclavibacter]PPF80857.1 2-dehydro-3-deoxyphosphogluconate aldolase [Pseudoclavibacter sp. RFBJ5]PPF94366.1 2-dehydro-3-deoxyphosphogluconate aldolase [Pseudoclavibacter sp. RFBJ3]PPF99473.1 2-dehydro-3-deoxyphosphogluconate aldolase [Pseudoclavibacter sp. RFBH5]PPG25667.1 2-dehydro-3-deoxyphosphogluconate aldolase [Pseudoclavibacter sp. RFBI4]PPG28259.1 2-dehydro-3-deo
MTDTFDTMFAGSPVMAILRGYTPERSVELANLAWSLGISSVEVPIQNDAALDALRAVVRAAEPGGHAVGAGTVVSLAHVDQAKQAGATFTVAPGLDPAVIEAAQAAGLAPLPGVASGTDIQLAKALGLTWVKAFPASVLGADWFSAMRGPFPEMRLVATGGINASNAGEYLSAGADVVAVGSALEDEAQLPLLSALRASAPAR